MSASKISIIVPVYNVEKYISRALQSCIDQSFKDIEIIVVDDCGQDKSMDIAYEFARGDHRIKIVHNPENLKLLKTRYEGVKASESDYIMFLDSDDYLDTSICEKIADVLEENNDQIDLLCFGILNERGGVDLLKQMVSAALSILFIRAVNTVILLCVAINAIGIFVARFLERRSILRRCRKSAMISA